MPYRPSTRIHNGRTLLLAVTEVAKALSLSLTIAVLLLDR
jgi:hypothetical protein